MADGNSYPQLQSTELSAAYSLLQLFCYGTWADYKGDSADQFDATGLFGMRPAVNVGALLTRI